MGYDPENPMKDRITDIGPPHYAQFFPPVIKKNYGKWLYHEITQPGVLKHVSETGDECYTVRVGAARLISVSLIRDYCTARAICGGPPATTSSSWLTAPPRCSRCSMI